MPSPGDWSISRNGTHEDPCCDFLESKSPLLTLQSPGALFVNGAEDLSVEQCSFVRLGGNALFLSGKAWRTRVTVYNYTDPAVNSLSKLSCC